MNHDDTLWKGILENIFDDFLRFFFPDAENIFDMEKEFQFLDKELKQLFPAKDMQHPKFVDKLVKVFTKDGRDEWMLVHVEVQGYKDDDFAYRMFTYYYRILDKYRKPITAIAILTDTNKNFHPTAYKKTNHGTSITFEFNTYKVIAQDERELEKTKNPFAIVVLTTLLALKRKQLSDADVFGLKLNIVRNLLKHDIPDEKIRALMNFIKFNAHFFDSEFSAKFEQAIFAITENKNTMGIEEMLIERFKKEGMEVGIKKGMEKGKKEGIEKGKKEVVTNLLLANKFTITEIANFANVTEAFVREVQESLKKL